MRLLLLALLAASCAATLAEVPCRTDAWHCTTPSGRCCEVRAMGTNGSCCEVP